MKELSKKTFITIFLILSLFLIILIIIFNVQNYNKEYEGIKRHLNMINKNDELHVDENTIVPHSIDNMMIMDYEVYTLFINNNTINRVIYHGNGSSDFNINSIANNILKNNNSKIEIGNLYTSYYAYNYKYNNTLVIINTEQISKKLNNTLLESIILLVLMEIFIYIISKRITAWITKPAIDALKKQKDFIADASHELKTPLAVIMASSDELKPSSNNKKYIDNIKYESERMKNLLKNMLDLSKIESGISKKDYKEENISKIMKKVCLTFESVAYEKNVKINLNIEENISFKCNKEEIERLITIILDNAVKHSYKDTFINANLKKIKNVINIEIINKGNPIKKGEEEKIFERFYRLDKSRNRDDNRYGLGLAIAKSIVLNHNGTISAKSTGNETIFKIILKK